MNKNIIILGAAAIAILIISTATSVPTVQGEVANSSIENSITEQKEYFINQLMTIYDQLKKDGAINTENEEIQYNDLNQDIDQSLNLNIEGFVDYITSDEFIQLLNENYYNILSNTGFQILWNSECIQEYVHSEVFIDFMNTDEVQYILDNLNPEPVVDQQVIQTQATNVNSQVLQTESEQENILNEMSQTLQTIRQTIIYNTQTDENLEGSMTPSSEETTPAPNIIDAFATLIVGILTWPFAILGLIIISPIYFIGLWFSFILTNQYYYGFCLPILSAIVSLIWTLFVLILIGVFWPIIWPFLFGIF